jgi:transcriptional regulator with XRE-family HTH domain
MKITHQLTDDAILTELGTRLAQRRLAREMTQAEVADQAGIAKRTLERIESGASAQMVSLIRVLRVLDDLSGLNRMIAPTHPRPMELLKHKGKRRQRASRRSTKQLPPKPWTWGDES